MADDAIPGRQWMPIARWWGWIRTQAMMKLAVSLGYRWFWIPETGSDRATVILMATTKEEYTRVYAATRPLEVLPRVAETVDQKQKDFTRVDRERRAAGLTGSTAASNEP